MLHTLSRSLRENKGPALVTVLLSALEVVFEIVIPLYMSNLIDYGIEGGSMAAVWKFGAFLLLLAAFQLATGVLAARIAARASVGFGANLREDMYNNVQTFAFSNIDKFSTASIVTRLTTDVTNVQNAFQMLMRMAIRSPRAASTPAFRAALRPPFFCRMGRTRLSLRAYSCMMSQLLSGEPSSTTMISSSCHVWASRLSRHFGRYFSTL